MSIKTESFGKTKEGAEITKYWIENGKGMKASVINYGAILVNLLVPNAAGEVADVVLGYDALEPYFENGSFFGATVGPNANRTANATFCVDGTEYKLDVNDGKNNLHSHFEQGYHKRVFDATTEDNSVIFSLKDEDGNMGFPGNKEVKVIYTLTEDNELKISYDITTDKKTVINMTNHTYFNLKGHDKGIIHDHILTLNCSKYTPVVAGAIPTGELADVKGTPFDFTAPKEIGLEIGADEEQLKLVGGYDHNWVIDNADGTLREIATVTEKTSGRTMKVYTDLPGVQFYAGNAISPCTGKSGAEYGRRSGMCLETQYYPDHANHDNFPKGIYGPDKKYESVTVYKFI